MENTYTDLQGNIPKRRLSFQLLMRLFSLVVLFLLTGLCIFLVFKFLRANNFNVVRGVLILKNGEDSVQKFPIGTDAVTVSDAVKKLQSLLGNCDPSGYKEDYYVNSSTQAIGKVIKSDPVSQELTLLGGENSPVKFGNRSSVFVDYLDSNTSVVRSEKVDVSVKDLFDFNLQSWWVRLDKTSGGIPNVARIYCYEKK